MMGNTDPCRSPIGHLGTAELADMVICSLKDLDATIPFPFRHRAVVQWVRQHHPHWTSPMVPALYPDENLEEERRRKKQRTNTDRTSGSQSSQYTLPPNAAATPAPAPPPRPPSFIVNPEPPSHPLSPDAASSSPPCISTSPTIPPELPADSVATIIAAQRRARLASSIFGSAGNAMGLGPHTPAAPTRLDGRHQRNTEARHRELSHKLSYLLRHGAFGARLSMRPDGFVPVVQILARPDFAGATLEDICDLCRKDSKQRYKLIQEGGVVYICAQQGHSLAIPLLGADPITAPEQAPICVHGTMYDRLDAILRVGLSRMNRQHIHFATRLPGPDGVVPGMCARAEVLIHLHVETCLMDGMKLLRSGNDVILTGGFGGLVVPKYFRYVEDARTHHRIQLP